MRGSRECILTLLIGCIAMGTRGEEKAFDVIRRGDAELTARHADAAIGAFKQCLQMIPRFSPCAYRLASAYSQKEETSTAVEWLRQAANWGFDNIEWIVQNDEWAAVRASPNFGEIAEAIQNRFPATRSRPYVSPEQHEQGTELVAMVRSKTDKGAAIVFGHDKDRLYLATANHVVRWNGKPTGSFEVQLKALTPRWFTARLLPPVGNPDLDLAVLAVDGIKNSVFNFCSLPLNLGGVAANLHRNDPVYPVGYPSGILWAMPLTPDHVSQVFPTQVSFESQFIRVGFSGGALINQQGEIVGMIVADEPPLGRVVPLDVILKVLRVTGYPVQLARQDQTATLRTAVRSGDAAAVAALLQACADPTAAVGDARRTALHDAAAQGSGEIVRLLLNAGARRDAWTVIQEERPAREWGTALHIAADHGNVDAVKALLDPANVDLQTLWSDEKGHLERGDTALHIAARRNREDVAAALLDAGADLEERGRERLLTPLGVAAEAGSLAVARLLLQHRAAIMPGDDPHPIPDLAPEWTETLRLMSLWTGTFKTKKQQPLPPLHLSARAGHVEILKLLVEYGADVNAVASGTVFATALHAAAAGGQLDAAAFLLAQKAAVDAPGPYGNTPLHVATENGAAAVVQLLVANGADLNRRNSSGDTAVQIAARLGDAAVLKELVKAKAEIGLALHEVLTRKNAAAASVLIAGGADVSLRNGDGAQPLHIAAANGLTEATELLLKRGAAVDDADADGRTPLHLAAAAGHLDIVDLLLASKAPVNARSAHNHTPLYEATVAKHATVVAHLLKAGADPKIDDKDEPMLSRVAFEGTLELLQMLLSAGADPNRTGRGHSPLIRAIERREGSERFVAELLRAGAKITSGDTTPLHAAIGYHKTAAPMLSLLLASGAPVDVTSFEHRTALHEAAFWADVDAVRVLLTAGANVRAKDGCNETPLWRAIKSGGREDAVLAIAELLVEHGADVNAPSQCHKQALVDLAEKNGYLKVRQYLLTKGAKSKSS